METWLKKIYFTQALSQLTQISCRCVGSFTVCEHAETDNISFEKQYGVRCKGTRQVGQQCECYGGESCGGSTLIQF